MTASNINADIIFIFARTSPLRTSHPSVHIFQRLIEHYGAGGLYHFHPQRGGRETSLTSAPGQRPYRKPSSGVTMRAFSGTIFLQEMLWQTMRFPRRFLAGRYGKLAVLRTDISQKQRQSWGFPSVQGGCEWRKDKTSRFSLFTSGKKWECDGLSDWRCRWYCGYGVFMWSSAQEPVSTWVCVCVCVHVCIQWSYYASACDSSSVQHQHFIMLHF